MARSLQRGSILTYHFPTRHCHMLERDMAAALDFEKSACLLSVKSRQALPGSNDSDLLVLHRDFSRPRVSPLCNLNRRPISSIGHARRHVASACYRHNFGRRSHRKPHVAAHYRHEKRPLGDLSIAASRTGPRSGRCQRHGQQ